MSVTVITKQNGWLRVEGGETVTGVTVPSARAAHTGGVADVGDDVVADAIVDLQPRLMGSRGP